MTANHIRAIRLFLLAKFTQHLTISKLSLLLIFTIFLGSCQEDSIEPEKQLIEPITVEQLVNSSQQERASFLVQAFQSKRANNRTTETDLGALDWSTAKVTTNNFTGAVHYAFPLEEDEPSYNTTNLIIQDLGDQLKVYRMRFVPTEQWLLQDDENAPFKGEIQLLHWNGDVASSTTQNLSNGRTMATGTCFHLDEGNNQLYVNIDDCSNGETWGENGDTPPVEVIEPEDPAPSTGGSGSTGDPNDGSSTGGGTPGDGGTPTDGSGSGTGSGDGGDDLAPCVLDANGNCVDVVEPVIKKPKNLEALAWAASIELDHSFTDNPCLMEVWNELEEKGILFDFLRNFLDSLPTTDKYPRGNVVFKVHDRDTKNDTLASNVYARTSKADDDGQITITLNTKHFSPENIKNTPIILTAFTILHESLHAEISRILYVTDETEYYLSKNFPEVYDALMDILTHPTNSDFDHEYIARTYIDLLKKGAKEFDSRDKDDHYYTSLAWSGLEATLSYDTLQQEHPDSVTAMNNTVKDIQNGVNEEFCDK